MAYTACSQREACTSLSADMQPSTPRRSPRRILFNDCEEPSPQFSDYWTDPGYSQQTSPSSAHPATTTLKQPNLGIPHDTIPTDDDVLLVHASSAQRQLLARLNSLGTRLLTDSPSDYLINQLGHQLDELEAVVSAPESQSKPSADIGDSGLFIDDDDDDDDNVGHEYKSEDGAETRVDSVTGAEIKVARPARALEVEEGLRVSVNATVQRVARVTLELKGRLGEVKVFRIHTNILPSMSANIL